MAKPELMLNCGEIFSHFTHLELVVTPNTHEDRTDLDTGSGAVSLAESSSHSSLEPEKLVKMKFQPDTSLNCHNQVNVSALWDFVFTFNQKQNWLKYHHGKERSKT